MITDSLNRNTNIKYDYRNLITQIQHKAIVDSDTSFYLTFYTYDEAGNRIVKTIHRYSSSGGPPENSSPGDPTTDDYWELYNVEIYSRDVSGREMAIYKNDTLLEYPTYGLNMIGKIKDEEVYFYMKDHLGSVRAVLNSTGGLVSAQDYDAWGYPLEGRTFNADSMKFKYTGKELDKESLYDYFGARYYDSRIANFGSVDPLLEKHFDFSPYNYVLRNPLRLVDPDGQQIQFTQTMLNIYNWYENDKIQRDYYNNLSLVGKEEFKKSQPDYNIGSIESAEIQPADFISVTIGVGLAKKLPLFAKTGERFVIEENIGLASDIGLDWLSGSKATRKNAEMLGKQLGEFLGDGKNLIDPKKTLTKFGNIKEFGKEVRIGFDKTHPFQHIDIERNVVGKKFKDLKLQIKIENF